MKAGGSLPGWLDPPCPLRTAPDQAALSLPPTMRAQVPAGT